jgi:hypothetical protein
LNMKRFGKIALGALMLGGAVAATTVPADARVAVGIGIGVPVGGYYGYGYPAYGYPYYGYPYYGYGYGYAPVVYGGWGRVGWHGRYGYRRPYYHRWHRW